MLTENLILRTAHAYITFLVLIGLLSEKVPDIYAQDEMPKELRGKYAEDLYIVRYGHGDTSESAAESARFEIAKFFESAISGTTYVIQKAGSKTILGKTIEKQSTEISNKIIISASREIPGIEIVLTEYDKKSKTYEAWAALDKNKHSLILRERINNIPDLTVTNLINELIEYRYFGRNELDFDVVKREMINYVSSLDILESDIRTINVSEIIMDGWKEYSLSGTFTMDIISIKIRELMT